MSKTSRNTARKARDLPRKIAAGKDEARVAAQKKPGKARRPVRGK